MKISSILKELIKEEKIKVKSLNEVRLLFEKEIQVGDTLTSKLQSIKGNTLARNMLTFLNSDKIKGDANVDYVDYNSDNEKLLTLGYKDRDGKTREKLVKLNKLMSYLGGNLENVKSYEVEDIINHLKKGKTENLKLFKGDDILKVYHCENYDEGETMGSCMRYEAAQEYLKIYTDNPNQVQVLALLNPENGKIRGRALIWTTDNGSKYMDRVYVTNKQWQVEFNNFAEKHGITKNSTSDTVTLENGGTYDTYPYMDTFEFYEPESGTLSPEHQSEEGWLQLTDTHGGGDEAGDWSEVHGERIPEDQSVYIEHIEDYVYDHEVVQSWKEDEWLYRDSDDVVRITAGEHDGGWALESDVIGLYNNRVAVAEEVVYIDGGSESGEYALWEDVVETLEGEMILHGDAAQLSTGQHDGEYTEDVNAWKLLSGDEEGEMIHDDDLDDYTDVKKVRADKIDDK